MVTMFWIQYLYSEPATTVVWEIARAQAVRQIVLHPNLSAIASREFVLLNVLLILIAMMVILSRLIAALITAPVGIFLFLIVVMASCKLVRSVSCQEAVTTTTVRSVLTTALEPSLVLETVSEAVMHHANVSMILMRSRVLKENVVQNVQPILIAMMEIRIPLTRAKAIVLVSMFPAVLIAVTEYSMEMNSVNCQEP